MTALAMSVALLATASAGVSNMIGLSGTDNGYVVHLRLTASDAAEPVSFTAVPSPPVPSPPVTVPVSRLARRRAHVISFTNVERATAHLGALQANVDLTRSAQHYAQRLAGDGAFSHTDGSVLDQRVTAAGYRFRFIGENLGLGQPNAKGVVAAWMASPEHRANMLDPRFTDIGVGVATRADGQIVWCIDLGWPSQSSSQSPLPSQSSSSSH